MKKILLTLLLLILFIPGVNAVEYTDECLNEVEKVSFNDYVGSSGYYYYDLTTDTFKKTSVNGIQTVKYLFNVEPTKTYYLRFSHYLSTSFPTVIYVNTYDLNKNVLNYYTFSNPGYNLTVEQYSDYLMYKFIIPENVYYINMSFQSGYPSAATFMFADFDLSLCPPEESEPETTPTIEPDTTLDNFYTLCINKLVELSNFTIENKFTLSALGIIIFFTIIGLFIHLFKGGRRQ